MSISIPSAALDRLWPSASSALRAAIVAQSADVCQRRGITSRLRLMHFLAQISHESDGGTIRRESMRYSAPRISEIFGVGHHSARVTPAEARSLAAKAKDDRGAALAERVYGLGNPSMAHDLGNTEPGDGWSFRGGGLTQLTGREAYARAAAESGVDLLADPDRVADPEICLDIAAADFAACRRGGKTCLEWADLDDVVHVTEALNGGHNGLASRREWLAKWRLALRDEAGETTADPSALEQGHRGVRVEAAQRRLKDLGYYTGRIDGKFGQGTEDAVAVFQGRQGLQRTGVIDAATWSALDAAPPKDVAADRAAAGAADVADHPVAQALGPVKGIAKGGIAAGLISAVTDASGDGDPLDKVSTAVAKVQTAKGLWGQVSDLAAPITGWASAHPGALLGIGIAAVAIGILVAVRGVDRVLVDLFRRGREGG